MAEERGATGTGTLATRRCAVVIDEAHSSQGGETATDLKEVLGGEGLLEEAKKRAAEEGREDMEELFRSMAKRGKQANLSFFAFTATPKHKTLAVFGRDGRPAHRYTMRQAIEEEFILDVLKHYTTYATYFKLLKACEDDPNVERKKAARALARFMKLHPHNIAQKTEVMVEHFQAVIYLSEEVERFSAVYFEPKQRQSAMDHQAMNAALDPAVSRFTARQSDDEEEAELWRGKAQALLSLYGFLSQVIPYQDSDLERLYVFLRHLTAKLPRRKSGPAYQFDDEVRLEYYRLQKISEGSISLREGEARPLDGPAEVGSGMVRPQPVALSQLIDVVNERFGTDFNQADQLFFDQIVAAAVLDEGMRQAAAVNPEEKFELVFRNLLEKLFVERMDQNEDIFVRFMNDNSFQKTVTAWMAAEAYRRLRGGVDDGDSGWPAVGPPSSLRIVQPKAAERYVSCVPLVPLKAAAGAFGDPQHVDESGWSWVAVETPHRLRPGMFVAQVVGKSMEPEVPDGAYVLFRAPVAGSRQGKTVLVQLRDDADPETGERYTVKRYASAKARKGDAWQHERITLKPANPDFQPIVVTGPDAGQMRVIAEVVEVL